ncbi:hypothetical protein GCM10009836_70710 [Pseudonocardia ailaonensis]|uniref:Uncharacterized protein n=1 Tax=Pseudonocardia ailaonensis TaxID=367279 RepID=A0ABN2NQQ3_9PSEU
MAVTEEFRTRLSDWCAECVPQDARGRRRIAYTTVGGTVTILDRRPPVFPELGAVWSSTPLAQLREDGDTGRWVLHIPTVDGGRWERQEPAADDPFVLLGRIRSAVLAAG